MTKNNFTTYTSTQRYGMEGIGDMEHEYMTSEEIEQNFSQEKERVKRLKESGLYRQEYTTTVSIEKEDVLDYKETKITESFKMVLIDYGKKNMNHY